MKRISKISFFAAAVAFLTLLIYIPTLQNQFLVWDDGDYISDNPHIRSLGIAFFKWAFSDFYAANWHPLTWLFHTLDYVLWGLHPLGHHLTNIILHALNAFLVVVLVNRLLVVFKERAGKNDSLSFLNERTALIAAGTTGLLFGIHPVHVESVAWVSERKDLLCGLFFLLSIIMYISYVKEQMPESGRNDYAGPYGLIVNKRYLATLGLFILALLSKPMAVSLPIVLLIIDWYPFERIHSGKTLMTILVEKIPLFLLSITSSVITVFAQKAGEALSSVAETPLPTRVLVAAKAMIAYLWKMVWPLNLIPFYPYPETASLASLEYFVPLGIVIGITIVGLVNAKKRKLWLAAWGYYCVTLTPVLGIVQVGSQSMADRYTYLPSLGPFLVTGLGMAWLWEKIDSLNRPRLFLKLFSGVASTCALIFLCSATIHQIGIWKNSLTLWSYVIEQDPTIFLAYNNRGLAYEKMERFDEAFADFDKAIELAPSSHLAYSNRGMLFGKTGQFDKAIEDFKKAITLNPSYSAAYNNLGIAYAKTGLVEKAMEQFNKAIIIDQGQAMAYYNRGLLYSRAGKKDQAASDYRKACDLGYDDACNALQR